MNATSVMQHAREHCRIEAETQNIGDGDYIVLRINDTVIFLNFENASKIVNELNREIEKQDA